MVIIHHPPAVTAHTALLREPALFPEHQALPIFYHQGCTSQSLNSISPSRHLDSAFLNKVFKYYFQYWVPSVPTTLSLWFVSFIQLGVPWRSLFFSPTPFLLLGEWQTNRAGIVSWDALCSMHFRANPQPALESAFSLKMCLQQLNSLRLTGDNLAPSKPICMKEEFP